MMKGVRHGLVAILAASTSLTLAARAGAQETGATAANSPATTSDSAQLTPDALTGSPGDIVVTARKRQETLQDVPVVANVVTGAQLQLLQTQDLKALSTLVPGLTLGSSLLSVGVQASLRGVGTSSLDPGVDQSVSLNIDGLSLSQGLAFASGLFDVGQIEVLKGPQSLFYGKGSPGGVISLRTADPTNHLELIARVGYEFEARERRVDLIASGPISETLKLRVAGTYGKQDGYFINPAQAIASLGAAQPDRRIPGGEDYKIRATLLWNPSPAFDARLKVNRARDDFDFAGAAQNVFCPDGTGPVFGRQFINPDCKLDRSLPLVALRPDAFPGVPNNGIPYNKTLQNYGTLELNYRPQPDLTLTSATGYYRVNSNSLANAAMSSAGAGLISASNTFFRRQFTQELRLASDFSSPLNFTVGAFIERGKFSDDVTIGGNTFLGAPAVIQKGKKTVRIRTNSVFGQLLYKITPELELAAGARYSDERRTLFGTFVTPATGVVNVAVPAVPRIRARNVAPEVTLTYKPNSDLTIFAAAKQGYKSGSFNVSTPPFNGENNAFGDERVRGGEIGVKSRLLDRTLNLNLAGYYYNYSGLQIGANVPSTNGITVTRTVNAGSARVYGIEAEATYRPSSIAGLNLRAAANWNNSRYTKLDNVPCYGGQTIADGCNQLYNPVANAGLGGFTSQNRSGLPLFRAPRWQGNVGFDYEHPVGHDMALIFANSNQLSSKYLTDISYIYYQRAFIKTDASLTLRGPNDDWQFAVIGKNLSDKVTSGNCANSNRAAGQTGGIITGKTFRGAAGTDEVGCYADRGREVWLRFTVALRR